MQNKVVLITGSGRSGSSILSRVLSLYGAALPDRIMVANEWNPRGYWESQDAVDLNDQFMHEFDSTWSDPSFHLQRDVDIPETIRAGFVAQIERIVRDGFPSGPCKVLKDPRLTVLLRYWIEGVRNAGAEPIVLHTFRDPQSYFRSVEARDGLTRQHAYALWIKYNLLGERDSRDVRRAFVSFEEVLNDWKALIPALADRFDLPLAFSEEARQNVEAFVTEDLWHHRQDGDALDAPEMAAMLHAELVRGFAADTASRAELDRCCDLYVGNERFFRSALRSSHGLDPAILARVERLEGEKAAFEGGCRERDDVIKDQNIRIADLKRESAAFKGGCDERDGIIVQLRALIADMQANRDSNASGMGIEPR